jgi:dimeric dUTPase (all-alpha-NTP-PPase superfamily)
MRVQRCSDGFDEDKALASVRLPEGDALAEMVRLQRDLQKAIGGPKAAGVLSGPADEEAAQASIKENVLAAHSELSEILDMVNWKSWKRSRQKVDWEELRFEVVDLLHFALNLAMASGMTAHGVLARYRHKHGINKARQAGAYRANAGNARVV